MNLIVGSPLQAESLWIHELFIALWGKKKIATTLATSEVFFVVSSRARISWLLNCTEHRSPVSICQVILLVVSQFTIYCYLLVHIQTIADRVIGKSWTTVLIWSCRLLTLDWLSCRGLVITWAITNKAGCLLSTLNRNSDAIARKWIFCASWLVSYLLTFLFGGNVHWVGARRWLWWLLVISHNDLIGCKEKLIGPCHHQTSTISILTHVFTAAHRFDYLLIKRQNLLRFAIIWTFLFFMTIWNFKRGI